MVQSLTLIVALPAALAASAGQSLAREIKLPADKPTVAFDVPDDWTVTEVKYGVELRAPDKSALVIAGLVKLSKAEFAEWQKQAADTMKGAGVKFDPKAKAPPRVVKPPSLEALGVSPVKPLSPAEAARAPDKPAHEPTTNAPDTTASTPKTPEPESVFSGKPTLATPDQAASVETATEDKSMEGLSLEQLTGKAPIEGPHMRFKSAVIYGATLEGRPVDVQFLNFAVAKDTAFLMQQESSPTDNLVGKIVTSVRAAAP